MGVKPTSWGLFINIQRGVNLPPSEPDRVKCNIALIILCNIRINYTSHHCMKPCFADDCVGGLEQLNNCETDGCMEYCRFLQHNHTCPAICDLRYVRPRYAIRKLWTFKFVCYSTFKCFDDIDKLVFETMYNFKEGNPQKSLVISDGRTFCGILGPLVSESKIHF